jgi:hypothetical protein
METGEIATAVRTRADHENAARTRAAYAEETA